MNEVFLQLVRLGIGHPGYLPYKTIDWNAIEALAERQGLLAIVLDGIEQLPEALRPPKLVLLQWIGNTMQEYEQRYALYCKAIADLAGFYHEHGYRMMVLKGLACSFDWPKPEHRPCGDIDIWQFGKQKEADKALLKAQGPDFKIDNSHEHHTVFFWHDFMVENHYDFIDIRHRRTSPQLEILFKEKGKDESHYTDLYGEKVYLPSPDLHALFLLRHSMEHFAATELTLRQLLDWAFFVEKHGKEVDWNWLLSVVEKYGMSPAFNIFNAICIEDLGFEASLFPQVQFNPFLKERVLNDLMSPEFSGEEPAMLIPRIYFKYRRWKANGWKHQLCYKDSMWSAFWSGVWSHLLKPSSI